MKLSRRTFLKFAAALVPAPLVARDMGDFYFLDTPTVKPAPAPKLVSKAQQDYSAGALRFNTTTSSMEVYDGSNWRKL